MGRAVLENLDASGIPHTSAQCFSAVLVGWPASVFIALLSVSGFQLCPAHGSILDQ